MCASGHQWGIVVIGTSCWDIRLKVHLYAEKTKRQYGPERVYNALIDIMFAEEGLGGWTKDVVKGMPAQLIYAPATGFFACALEVSPAHPS